MCDKIFMRSMFKIEYSKLTFLPKAITCLCAL